MLNKEIIISSNMDVFNFTIEERITEDYMISDQGYGFYNSNSLNYKFPYWVFNGIQYKLSYLIDRKNSGSRIELKPISNTNNTEITQNLVVYSGDRKVIFSAFSKNAFKGVVVGTSSEVLGLKEKYLSGIKETSVIFDPQPTLRK